MSDWMLSQGTVDFRSEERAWRNGRTTQVRPPDEQTAICTSDPDCQAAADQHNPDCPVEQRLQDEFGGF